MNGRRTFSFHISVLSLGTWRGVNSGFEVLKSETGRKPRYPLHASNCAALRCNVCVGRLQSLCCTFRNENQDYYQPTHNLSPIPLFPSGAQPHRSCTRTTHHVTPIINTTPLLNTYQHLACTPHTLTWTKINLISRITIKRPNKATPIENMAPISKSGAGAPRIVVLNAGDRHSAVVVSAQTLESCGLAWLDAGLCRV